MLFQAFTIFVVLIGFSRFLENLFRARKLPPGPPRLASLLMEIKPSSTTPWKALASLSRRYGPVMSFYRGSTPVVVLGTLKAATDFLEKKGGIYSSRPRNILAGEILSRNLRGVIMPYGKRWRNWRTLMQAGLGIESSNKYKAVQSFESSILLHDLLNEENPNKYSAHFRRFAISVVFCMGYGRRIKYLDDPLVVKNQNATESNKIIYHSAPGYLVESWPILLKLPRRLQWFARDAYKQREIEKEMCLAIWNEVKKNVEEGTAMPSISKRALEKQDKFELDDLELAYGVAAPFGAGVVTTLATLEFIVVALLNHPDVMHKVQAEVDNVVGRGRLPDFCDMDLLPYTRAVILETMRWRPITPLGLAHASISDDEYEDGRYIPSGTTMIPNIYAMSKDEEMFPSPEKFKPERYLEVDKANPNSPNSTFLFGFGRRICPGRHVALNSLFIVL
ncbi:cytochrome P450, partial [Agrocybe pediades]